MQDDRSLINLHLMHTSYFLFVMVITMFCYAVVKGRPGKVRLTNPDFCPEKVPHARAGSVREVVRLRWRVVLCFRWRYRRAESVLTGEEKQRPCRLRKHTRDTQVLVCPTKDEKVPVTDPVNICRNFEFTFCLVLISARVVSRQNTERKQENESGAVSVTQRHLQLLSCTVLFLWRFSAHTEERVPVWKIIRATSNQNISDRWDETSKLYHLYIFCLFRFLQWRLCHSPPSSCVIAAIFSIFVVGAVSPEQNMILPYLYGDSSAYRHWQGFLSVFSCVCVCVRACMCAPSGMTSLWSTEDHSNHFKNLSETSILKVKTVWIFSLISV